MDVSFAISVGVSVPPTCPDEAGSVASAASTIWQLPVAILGSQPFPASVRWLALFGPAASVQLLIQTVVLQIQLTVDLAALTAPVPLSHLPAC